MKKTTFNMRTLLFFCLLALGSPLTAQVSVNQDNSAPDPSAMLDVKSSDKGLLVPRMTTAQRTAIANPATGLLVFDTDNESFWYRDSGGWVRLISGWNLTGNAGTVDGANFIGTTDNVALDFRVNNARGLRLEYAEEIDPLFGTTVAPNLIGGFSGNTVAAGVIGATISGGGRTGGINATSGSFSTIGGGYLNTVDGYGAVVSGGQVNNATGGFSTVGGGSFNTANGNSAVVSGGQSNNATGSSSTVGGGALNNTMAQGATVAGGEINRASGLRATVGGGANNTASGTNATIGGGGGVLGGSLGNTAAGYSSTVPGGSLNSAGGDYSLAAGRRAKIDAAHDGAFLFSDGNNVNFNSAAANEFAARATGGVRFVTAIDGSGNPTQTVSMDNTGTVSAAAFVGDGSGLTNLPAGTGWNLSGNTGTVDGTNFIGTTDSVALDFRVYNERGLRLEYAEEFDPFFGTTTPAPNIIGGFSGNTVAAGVLGATISGGGKSGGINTISAQFATIGGGLGNAANGYSAVVAGGRGNSASGYSSIGGGSNNTASGGGAVVSGGQDNSATGIRSTVGGGETNAATAQTATVSGGEDNSASGLRATVGGGAYNTASGTNATIGGGGGFLGGSLGNTASGVSSTVPGGSLNSAGGDYSLAAGRRAKIDAAHHGAFLFSDGNNVNFNSAAANEFAARATGGVRFVTAIDGSGNPTQTVSMDNTGTVSAAAFVGDGSGLTGIPDDQTLSLSGATLSIENGNSVNLSGIGTDDQMLSLSGSMLSIENGNSVNLSSLPGDNLGNHTATQNLTLNGKWLSGDGGNEGVFVDASGKVGIGKSNPNEQLEITGNFRLPATTATTGAIYAGVNSFIHNYGSDNFFAGVEAGNFTTSGTGGNTGIGDYALHIVGTGIFNTAVGYQALLFDTSGSDNTAIGFSALRKNYTGSSNTAIGHSALENSEAGSFNIAIGREAGKNTDADNNILIGHGGVAGESNAIYLGNILHTKTILQGNVGIGTTSPANKLSVSGNADFADSVGVGTTTPDEKLHINDGNLKISQTATPTASLELEGHTDGGNQRSWTIATKEHALLADGSDLAFSREGSEKMRIDTDGNVGIGATTPVNKLSVSGNADFTGNVGIGIASPATRLHVEGAASGSTSTDFVATIKNTDTDATNSTRYNGLKIQAGKDNNNGANSRFIAFYRPDGSEIGTVRQDGASTVNYSTSSDVRLKQHIVPTAYSLADLLKIDVQDYEFRTEPGRKQTGFIAQDLYKVYPAAVSKGGEDVQTDPWMVDYGKLTPLLVKSVQDQQATIEAQQKRIAELEAQLSQMETLKAQNADFEKRFEVLEAMLRGIQSAPGQSSRVKSE